MRTALIGFIIICAGVAWAEDVKVEGWNDLRFGMTPSEVRAVYPNAKSFVTEPRRTADPARPPL